MVMLPSTAPIDAGRVLARLRDSASDTVSITDISIKNDIVTGQIPGGLIGMAQMPVPIPLKELEWPAKIAWHWPSAQEDIARHHSHVIVSATSNTLDRLDLHLFHTRLVAALLEVSGAIGVYAGGAMLVLSSPAFIEFARDASRENLPLLCWVGVHPVAEKDKTASAYTVGMKAFGFLELEIRRSRRAIDEVIGRLADMGQYQILSGRHLNDGDTFGVSETERHRVRHVRSDFLGGDTVARLEE
jgi:hypothetical protein